MSKKIHKITKNLEAKTQHSISQKPKSNSVQTNSSPLEHVWFLQRTIGNQAVQRQLKGRNLSIQMQGEGSKVETKLKDLVKKMKDAKTKANAGWVVGALKTLLFDVEAELKSLRGQHIPESGKQHLRTIKGIATTIIGIGLRDNKDWLQAAAIKVRTAADALL